MCKDRTFFKNYNGSYTDWYKDNSLAIKFINLKGFNSTNINDMLVVRNIGERFVYKSENTDIHLFGYLLCATADKFIASQVEMDKHLETIYKANKKKAKRRV